MLMGRFGLIGNPVAGSLSPALFNAGYAGVAEYDLIEGSDFMKSWQTFLDSYDGINITAPFKEQAFSMGQPLTGYCQKIGAANIAVKTAQGVVVDNSDFTGIVLSIAQAYIPGIVGEFYGKYGAEAHIKIHQFTKQALSQLFSRKPQALIVGCGGAGKAAAVAAAELGFDTALMNRTPEKAQKLADSMPEYGFIVDQLSDFRAAFRECDLIIYTLPLKINNVNVLTADDLQGEDRYRWPRPGKVVLEANYKSPSFAGVMEIMQSSDCQYVSGRRWLLYQALTGYGRLTGMMPDMEAMKNVLK